MNERIQQLIERACEEIAGTSVHEHPISFSQKLSELIVRECMRVADLPLSADGRYDDRLPSEMIAQHFGVE